MPGIRCGHSRRAVRHSVLPARGSRHRIRGREEDMVDRKGCSRLSKPCASHASISGPYGVDRRQLLASEKVVSDSIRMLKRAAPATTKEYHGSRAAVTTMGCFRECDVRGTYPDEVDEQLFRAIGGAIARRFRGEGQIVVAHDVRVSSCSLSSALIEGIVGCGGHVVDLGLVPTPVVYFNRSQLDAAAGVIVTASHNPPQYNGIKLLFRNGPATCQNIIEISKDLQRTVPVSAGGTCNRCDGLEEYGTQMQRRWDSWTASTPITRFPAVVLDPGNGTWSRSAKQFLERLGASCRVLHDDPDGTFPGRSPDCASPGSLARLGATVREYGAEAGLAWDGDGDRLAVVDASGKSLTADQVGLLLALNMPLRGERVLVDIKMSRKVAEAIAQRGGIPVVERSAHCALERTMIK